MKSLTYKTINIGYNTLSFPHTIPTQKKGEEEREEEEDVESIKSVWFLSYRKEHDQDYEIKDKGSKREREREIENDRK